MNARLALGPFLLSPIGAQADQWPQWMGPNRDGVWSETGIIDAFPTGGAKVVWRVPIAGGCAGPAVADGKVYVTDRAHLLKPTSEAFGQAAPLSSL